MLCYIKTDSVEGFSSTLDKYMYAIGSSLFGVIWSMFDFRCSIFAAHCMATLSFMFNTVSGSFPAFFLPIATTSNKNF
jgi:hypothetical protein